jgi:glutathione-independent formaldehyde dehydrogenase
VVIVGDLNAERLAQARSFGCETVDVSQDAPLEDQVAEILGVNEVDCGVDAVGFEARGHGTDGPEAPAAVLNSIMSITARPGAGHPGALRDRRPGRRRRDDAAGHAEGPAGAGSGHEPLRFATGHVPGAAYHPRD